MQENWDDLRFVLAVADIGSVSGAARSLGVNHATVLRRIAAFELREGITLFDKSARGYAVSADCRRIVEAAREVDAAVQGVGRMMRGAKAPLSGVVRVTSTDSFSQIILPPITAGIRADAPGLRVDLLCSNNHVDLSRTHADITVRPTQALPDDLFGVRVAELGFGVYQAAGYDQERWLGLAGSLGRARVAQWMADAVPAEQIGGSADSFLVLKELAAAGQGRAILPCFLGDDDPRLNFLPDAMPPTRVGIWVASHVDLADVPRIAQLRGLLGEGLARIAPRLYGRV